MIPPTISCSILMPMFLSVQRVTTNKKRFKNRGFNAYKLHPPGDYDFDLEAHKEVRKVVGDKFKLMSDPVAPYTFEQALRFGRELEKLNYYWYEEPLFDENFHNLRELTRI